MASLRPEPTVAELVARLDWARLEPRSAYDATLLATVTALTRELAEARQEIRLLREGLQTLDVMRLDSA